LNPPPNDIETTLTIPGYVLNGRYRLGQMIGRGGMACVFAADDLNFSPPKIVAVKVLNNLLRDNPAQLKKFRAEAHLVSRLNHPCIVNITDFGIEDCVPYHVMEFLEGHDLHQELKGLKGPMPWGRAVSIVTKVCEALTAAHGAGIVHRDIKPSNCFLVNPHSRSRSRGDYVKLLDLGIATLVDSSRRPSTESGKYIVGTAGYISPEQAAGKSVDGRADIYSLGVMLYHMVAGVLPFRGARPLDIMYMHVNCSPQAPSDYNRNIPPLLESTILKCLQKCPEERWQSAETLRLILSKVLEDNVRKTREFGPLPNLDNVLSRRSEETLQPFRERYPGDSQLSTPIGNGPASGDLDPQSGAMAPAQPMPGRRSRVLYVSSVICSTMSMSIAACLFFAMLPTTGALAHWIVVHTQTTEASTGPIVIEDITELPPMPKRPPPDRPVKTADIVHPASSTESTSLEVHTIQQGTQDVHDPPSASTEIPKQPTTEPGSVRTPPLEIEPKPASVTRPKSPGKQVRTHLRRSKKKCTSMAFAIPVKVSLKYSSAGSITGVNLTGVHDNLHACLVKKLNGLKLKGTTMAGEITRLEVEL